ncbi:hypothetical protein EVAR_90790_1 [Eumeta japonica]|uniref:Uncharacterized protein n=1 Tax=Eumeta variegata TaxID=151549 RepID=A0A4C2ACU7_EUMVA|nr:hypothetical protein EVAR_90790_1 [Eumeta japonica]
MPSVAVVALPLDPGTGSMSPNVTDFGFAFAARGASGCIGCTRIADWFDLIRMQVTNFLVDPSCPGEPPLKFSFVPGPIAASTTCPFLTTGLSAHPLTFCSLGCGSFCAPCNTLAVHLQVQFFNLQSQRSLTARNEVPGEDMPQYEDGKR